MQRREFLRVAAGAAALGPAAGFAAAGQRNRPGERLFFRTDDAKLQAKYDAALAALRENTIRINRFVEPVLIEGGPYGGIWLECGPLEGLVYGLMSQPVAFANHQIFFDFQREDGYIPCWVRRTTVGSAQIQMVVPIAATAWELYQWTRNREFLITAYRACSRWDAWLMKYRNTRGTGLCEAFCEFDTGHDNSPRFSKFGVPKRCENGDARICPKVPVLPYLAPDLSASVYGGRVALAAMAHALGLESEAASWTQAATQIQMAMMDRLYDPHDVFFYDLNNSNQFVKVRGDVITRVLSEHVVTKELFEAIYRRHLRNPAAFWAPYPFPSIAMDDPSFVRPIPRNSWGGASQALTALRTPRWMEHYGKFADLAHLMRQWVKALVAAEGFLQQIDPITGQFTPDPGPYSPACLVMMDFCWRLYGVRRQAPGMIEWNCRLPEGAGNVSTSVPTDRGTAELRTSKDTSELLVGGRPVLQVKGTVRVCTDGAGKPIRLTGTEPRPSEVVLKLPTGRTASYTVPSDGAVQLG